MNTRVWLNDLKFWKSCEENRIGFFECPSALFVVMGIVNAISMIGGYTVSSRYFEEPQIAALTATLISAVVLVIGHFVIQSFEKIADANRLKSDFLNIATHQMLTPLTSVNWISEYLLNKKNNEISTEVADYMRMIKQSNGKLIKLITDLLDVNRIEENRIEMHPEPIDLLQVTKDTIREAVPISDFPNAEINLTTEGENFIVLVDPLRLKMVVQNLIDNAIKYSVTKKDISVRVVHSNASPVRFEIEDKGVGIQASEHAKIFKKFSRGNNVKMVTGGSGLGLFIAKFIIEKAGGMIGFSSEEGKGSTFWFTLPSPAVNN